MARPANPFRPGFNASPPVLVGRDHLLDAVREALAVAALDGRTPRPIVITGTRGVGKTVALGEAAALAASEHSWPTVHVEVRPGRDFTPLLTERVIAAGHLLEHTTADERRHPVVTGGRVGASALGVGGEVEVHLERREPGPVDPLEAALRAAMRTAMEEDAGLVITLDEVQYAQRAELAGFTAILQEHMADQWPLVVLVAGLPSIREPRRTVTYLERGEWHELGLLSLDEAEQALTGPAADAGRPLSPDAARALATESGGYPYAVQLYGHHAWRASTGADRILLEHAEAARIAARRELEAGLYVARWNDASEREREYLAATARLILRSGEATGGAVAAELGKAATEVSYLRDRLIKKGTLYPEGSRLLFITPGMAEWVAGL
ncbi:ATP-binding protein [Intrasporangium calvum]|uniref:ATP-binding protein n=1 Tax=Intrasporangium calvum TaxID=53358 RepID=A0ABT5GEU3_9MICO|nr:ATP-binding protein [Intrasporangium calvum]MDC5696663.1 ATP-binding protein [Intrasporangium calvum]